jgi:monofunctional biosynthetic peptidoglycan transglycosylase
MMMDKIIIKKIRQVKYATFILAGLGLMSMLWFYFYLPNVAYLVKVNPKTTAFMELRRAQAEVKNKQYRLKQTWVNFETIPALLKKAIRITEDSSFYAHKGVDWFELQASIKKNIKAGRFVRGGSTISQQLAKNIFLSTDKSLFRKFKELFITYRLEKALSKDRIFHIYLNVIEFGPGVFGVQSASRFHFNKDVNNLNLAEIVRLTAVIPRPLSISASAESSGLKWKSRWILNKLKTYKYITVEQYNAVIYEFK